MKGESSGWSGLVHNADSADLNDIYFLNYIFLPP